MEDRGINAVRREDGQLREGVVANFDESVQVIACLGFGGHCPPYGDHGGSRGRRSNIVWKHAGPKGTQMHQAEHNELFASIRSGKPISTGDFMTKSTMLAILGRTASYTGQKITWEQAMNS